MKTTPIRSCQSCGKPFAHGDIVYFVPLDNNVVCLDCAIPHLRTEKRIVEHGTALNNTIQFYSIPAWTKFIAQDHNGKWWAFEEKPELTNGKEWNTFVGRVAQVMPVLSSTLREVNR